MHRRIEGLVTQWKDEGIDTYTFSDAELASLTDSMKLVGQDWLERINADGAEAVLENYRALTSK